MNKKVFRRLVNIFIAVGAVWAWLSMFRYGGTDLAEMGVKSLKFFTVLSNLFASIASVIWLISDITKGKASERAEKIKYTAAVSVSLTFTVVMTFLGPLYGYLNLLNGGNLYLHMVIPVIAALEMIFLADTPLTRRDNFIAVIPTILYGIGYLVNILINGIGSTSWPDTNDWYLFFHWGYPVGALLYLVICTATWLLGLLIRKLRQRRIS